MFQLVAVYCCIGFNTQVFSQSGSESINRKTTKQNHVFHEPEDPPVRNISGSRDRKSMAPRCPLSDC